jgi:hypothetical protein
MTPEEFVKITAPALQALAILVTAIFASLGLNTWRRQLVGKRRFEVGEDLLIKAHKAKMNFGHVRNPVGFSGEGDVLGGREGSRALERIQRLSGDLAELTTARILAEIHIGPKAAERIAEILDAFHEVGWAATMLVMRAETVIPEDKSEREKELDKRRAWRLTIYGDPRDELAKRVDAAVAALERDCRRFLA